jgi:radical SAM protein with 4Fe4S-binding SPASM domain
VTERDFERNFRSTDIVYRPLKRLAFVANAALVNLIVKTRGDPSYSHPEGNKEALNFLETIGFWETDPNPSHQGRGTGSFEAVKRTAQLLSQSPTELCFRVCVSQESVTQLEQIVQWFCEAFRPSMINVETLQPTLESESAGLKPPDPYDFAIHYVRANRIVEDFGITAVYASAATDTLRHSFCPVGKDTLIVSPDGRVSSCYLPQQEWQKRGLNLDVGWLSADGTMQIDFGAINQLRQMVMEKPRCERCFCRWTCAGGCHVNHSYPGCSLEYDDFCIQTRIITVCSLLDDLGFQQVVDTLLENPTAMEALALQSSDCLL